MNEMRAYKGKTVLKKFIRAMLTRALYQSLRMAQLSELS